MIGGRLPPADAPLELGPMEAHGGQGEGCEDSLSRYAKVSGLGHAATNVVFDIEQEAPSVLERVYAECGEVRNILAGLRTTLPLCRSAAVGVNGRMYRLPIHYRSVAYAVCSGDAVFDSPVIVFKGSEPLLPDFDAYLNWMTRAEFGHHDLPLGLHLPMIGRPPACFLLEDCRVEQNVSIDVQRKHLARYGTLARCPIPLLAHRLADGEVDRYLEVLRRHLPAAAVDRIESRVRRGLSVGVFYYPASPVRVADLARRGPSSALDRWSRRIDAEQTILAWARLFVHLLYIGYMPYATWNAGHGSCADQNNACVDGGFADLAILTPLEVFRDDHVFRAALLASVDFLARTVHQFCDIQLRQRSDLVFKALVHVYLRTLLTQQFEMERPPDVAADPRVVSCFTIHTLSQLMMCGATTDSNRDPYCPVGPESAATL